jgi:hypothetical protein
VQAPYYHDDQQCLKEEGVRIDEGASAPAGRGSGGKGNGKAIDQANELDKDRSWAIMSEPPR